MFPICWAMWLKLRPFPWNNLGMWLLMLCRALTCVVDFIKWWINGHFELTSTMCDLRLHVLHKIHTHICVCIYLYLCACAGMHVYIIVFAGLYVHKCFRTCISSNWITVSLLWYVLYLLVNHVSWLVILFCQPST